MKRLTKEQVLRLHADLIEEFGGIHGLRDEGLLESALSAPFQTFDGQDLYPSVLEKAGRLGYGLIRNHPFLDGNKRIGVHALLVCLALNGVRLSYDDEDLIQTALGVASGSVAFEELCRWLSEHMTENEN
ncbi:MAG: type II toxin-antitoxin system death-on-curing family toxin [Oscillospiraceae bacterium]|nr:type II toxin-antitoxin system death-on-curing family toxin [Oscillospiraceae bacterium]